MRVLTASFYFFRFSVMLISACDVSVFDVDIDSISLQVIYYVLQEFVIVTCDSSNVESGCVSHICRSSQIGILKNVTKFTGKHLCQNLFFNKAAGYLCQSLFFNKIAGLTPATLLKKRLWHRCFPVNFVKFLRTPF